MYAATTVDVFDEADDLRSQIITKLRIGGDVGIPAATLCITRQLEAIAAARQAQFSAKDRYQRRIVDLSIGLGLPLLVMSLHTVVQGHRYDVIQRVGCIPAVYWSLPAVFLVIIWPVILLLAAAVYAGKLCLSSRVVVIAHISIPRSRRPPVHRTTISIRSPPRILEKRHLHQPFHPTHRPLCHTNRLLSPRRALRAHHPIHHDSPQSLF